MNNLRNIWQHLQDHEEVPPGEVYLRLLQLLKKEKEDDVNIKISDALRGLNEYEVQPPVSVHAVIKNITSNSSKHTKGNFISVIKKNRYRLIAACLLLASAIWGIDKMTNFSKSKSLAVKENNTIAPIVNDSATLAQGKPVDTTAHDTINSSLKNSGIQSPAFEKVRINGQWIPLTDNDLFVTLTGFKYNNIPSIITAGNDEDIPVHLDRYSTILITKTMSGMLKEMYQVKANGTPTRKARKSREKLKKWKKADESFFDGPKGKNPLDPIDMAEFIFK